MRVETIGDATLYLGDCLEILPIIPRVDAVVTDPPYGVNFKYEGRDDSPAAWESLMVQVVPILQRMATVVCMPVCDQLRLGWWYQNFPPKWLIAWHKGPTPTLSKIGFSDWEPHLVWGRAKKPMHDHFTIRPPGIREVGGHPCPKPVGYSEWLVNRLAERGHTVLDPFMGSGTTGVACANLGRKFIGIEVEPKYFDIACERIAAAYAQRRLFA